MIDSKGQTWNESELYHDPVTGKRVRRITRTGLYNQTPTYHTGTAWSADGQWMIFASARNGGSALFRCHVPTGDITQVTQTFDGAGCLDELHKGSGTCVGNGYGVTMLSCIAPHSGEAVFVQGRSLRAVNIHTCEERVLIDNYGDDRIAGMPSIDPTEQTVLLPVMSAHPEINAGLRPTKTYMEHFSVVGPNGSMLQVPLMGGDVTVAHSEQGVGCAHCPHCPTDPNLVLIDRDLPPKLWGGSDGKTNRIWTVDLTTHTLTELPNQDEKKFQVHSAWTWDGSAVVYHGQSALGGHYIGVVSKTGETVREYKFPRANHYGHVGAMANRPAIILDGNLTPDMLCLLYYDKEEPRVEMVARHGTNWGGLPWQYPHPHATSDPTGGYITYNMVERGRSDVFIVEM